MNTEIDDDEIPTDDLLRHYLDAEVENIAQWLLAERQRARETMIAEGMPPAVVDHLLAGCAQDHEAQVAMVQRELWVAAGEAKVH
jgi:hypothetical protein